MRGKKAVKFVVSVVLAAVIAGGSYYMGYNNHASSIISAIPKQSVETPVPEAKPVQGVPVPAASPAGENNAEGSESGKYIGKSTASAAEATWSKIDSYELDINSDGVEELITLSTSAETDSGEILWNDSQKWVLEVKSEDGYYILLNQSISNGRVYFDVDEISENTYAITVYTVTNSGKNIKQYTYSKTGFVEKQIYSVGTRNSLHMGIPMYQ